MPAAVGTEAGEGQAARGCSEGFSSPLTRRSKRGIGAFMRIALVREPVQGVRPVEARDGARAGDLRERGLGLVAASLLPQAQPRSP